MIIKTITSNKQGFLKTKIEGVRLYPGQQVTIKFANLEEYNTLLRSGFFFESNKGEDIPVIRTPKRIDTAADIKSPSISIKEQEQTIKEEPHQEKICSMCDTTMIVTFMKVGDKEKEIYVCPKCDYEEEAIDASEQMEKETQEEENKQTESMSEEADFEKIEKENDIPVKPKRKRRKSKKDEQQEIKDSFE
jgi:hypothetical protein